ncbi:hypothetical protein ACI78V_14655 [Geodermatophilus sp. SYSU D00742]
MSFALATLGGVSYAALYSFDHAFLHRFGTSPEEVGLSQAGLVARATLFGLLMLAAGSLVSFAAFAVLWIVVSLYRVLRYARALLIRGRGRGDSYRPDGAAGRIRWHTRGIAGSAAGFMALMPVLLIRVGLREWPPATYYLIGLSLFFLVTTYGLFHLVARRSHPLALVALAVLAIAWVGLMARGLGLEAAEGVMNGEPETFAAGQYTAVRADQVCIYWAPDTASERVPIQGVYLGHADGVNLVSQDRRLYRIADEHVVAIVTPVRPPGGGYTCGAIDR